jgi:hypothetical protein
MQRRHYGICESAMLIAVLRVLIRKLRDSLRTLG